MKIINLALLTSYGSNIDDEIANSGGRSKGLTGRTHAWYILFNHRSLSLEMATALPSQL